MLVELSIENLGVIESARLHIGPGFTVLTGETGAGKTMLVEAINLVVGRRADATVVRAGAEDARVEARFVGPDDAETILCRVVHREGRSRAYIDGRMATITALAEAGERLVDIHGQNAHQGLASGPTQRAALDSFGRVDLAPLRAAREDVTAIEASLAALGGDERTRAREIDLLRFQCDEIEGARLDDDDEDARLEAEEDRLADVVRLREVLWAVTEALAGDAGAAETLGASLREALSVSGLGEITGRLQSLAAEVADVAAEVRRQAESAEEDPARLAEIRERRNLLRDLRRKYGDSLGDVRRYGSEARTRLDELEGHAERVSGLEKRLAAAMKALGRAQEAVGEARRAAAPALAAAVEARLTRLAMPNARLGVSVGDAIADPAGDVVTFLLAANPGSPPLPLSKVASGGELARTMLALRLVLSSEPATMVFDEVDAGIGGQAAVAVAEALRDLGDRHQVLAVTHLPQVAAAADHHIVVAKSVARGTTRATAQSIDDDARAEEIARMLSGGAADSSALPHARELIATLGRGTSARKKRG